MLKIFLPLFIIIPVLELYCMILLGKHIGLLYTMVIIGSTGFIGIFLAKSQGWQVIAKIRFSLRAGQVPGNHVLEGFLVLIGAIFLLTPGLITDSFGFLLLMPWTRKKMRDWIKTRILQWITKGQIKIYY